MNIDRPKPSDGRDRNEGLPTVTVIMPVRNESDYIDGALGAVLAQDYPANLLQILVVDGMSEDDTRAKVKAAAVNNPSHTITIVENPGLIAPCALNAGMRQATGEVVVRVDGHCEIGTEYVRNGVRHLQTGEGDGVGGVLETVGETRVARAIAVAMSSPFGVGGSAFRTSDANAPARLVDTVAFPAYWRSVLDQAGPFDEELVRNQDDEYNYRLRKAGRRILLVPDMPVRYSSRADLKALLRQYFQYGFWKVRVLQKHPRQMSLRQFLPPILVLAILGMPAVAAALFLAMGLDSTWVVPLTFFALSPVVAYITAILVAAGTEAATRKVSAVVLATAFAAMHLGYGAGFLLGLIRFVGRWSDRGPTLH